MVHCVDCFILDGLSFWTNCLDHREPYSYNPLLKKMNENFIFLEFKTFAYHSALDKRDIQLYRKSHNSLILQPSILE